jgi:hypothetical protein
MNITVHGPLASYEVGRSGAATNTEAAVQAVAVALLGGAILHGPRGVTAGPWRTAVEGFRGHVTLLEGDPLPGAEAWRDYRHGLYAPLECQQPDVSAFGAALVFVEVCGVVETYRTLDRWRER